MLAKIRSILKRSKIIYNAYITMKKARRTRGRYKFVNRKKDKCKVCIVLAGYKEYLWGSVFERLSSYLESDIDVCIVSSGLYSSKLNEICEKNQWSYLSTKRNKLALAQNIAINLHPQAKLIYKLDEDIFIPQNYFKIMEMTYNKAVSEGKYDIGFVGALLSVHGYGSMRILEKLGKIEEAEQKFGHLKYGEIQGNPCYKDPEFAKFMWGKDFSEMSSIDKLSQQFAEEEISYSFAPFRFGIGAILMPRRTWEDMDMFPVKIGVLMGDEEAINYFCFFKSKVIIVAENTLVGHFSYYPQNEEMKKYYFENRKLFSK